MSYPPPRSRRSGGRSSAIKIRLLIAGAIVLFSLVSYMMSSQVNPVTGEAQKVRMSVEEEIQMGLSATPQMAQQHDGFSDDRQASSNVRLMGERLVSQLRLHFDRQGKEIPYPFEFHLLADERTVNAFALPGGQVFITEALYYRLTDAGQLAGVLGHEIGHVIERHGAERMAKAGLWQGIAGAAGVAGGDANSAQMASMVGQFIQMKYGRDDELESDRWGVASMVLAGYHPDHMLSLMDILEETSGGGGQPEFMSTHPRPANRKAHIEQIVAEKFPDGLPRGLR